MPTFAHNNGKGSVANTHIYMRKKARHRYAPRAVSYEINCPGWDLNYESAITFPLCVQ